MGILKFTPAADPEFEKRDERREPVSTSSSLLRGLLSHLMQVNVPVLQRRAAQEELYLRVAGNGGPGHQPFRSVPVNVALSTPALWDSRDKSAALYALSHSAVRATHFISHHWVDTGARKAALLRDFLCVQPLIAGLLVCLPILAAILLPLGFTIHFAVEGPTFFYIWLLPIPRALVPSLLPFGGLLAALLWVVLSSAGCVPVRYTPWRNSDETLWLENSCVEEAGVSAAMKAGFTSYLNSCDRMIAIVSPGYFTRLWCVFELATFMRRYDGPLRKFLDMDVTLLSPEWGWTLNPCKRVELTPRELAPIQNFRCRRAQTLKPIDRAILLSNIRKEWGSEDAFDAFVRAEIPPLLARNKLRFVKHVGKLAGEHIDLAFGA